MDYNTRFVRKSPEEIRAIFGEEVMQNASYYPETSSIRERIMANKEEAIESFMRARAIKLGQQVHLLNKAKAENNATAQQCREMEIEGLVSGFGEESTKFFGEIRDSKEYDPVHATQALASMLEVRVLSPEEYSEASKGISMWDKSDDAVKSSVGLSVLAGFNVDGNGMLLQTREEALKQAFIKRDHDLALEEQYRIEHPDRVVEQPSGPQK